LIFKYLKTTEELKITGTGFVLYNEQSLTMLSTLAKVFEYEYLFFAPPIKSYEI